jgi:hypothetical protein
MVEGALSRDVADRVPSCWGRNDHGQLAGPKDARVLSPAPASRVQNDGVRVGSAVPVGSAGSTCFEGHEEYESGCTCYGELEGLDFYALYSGASCKPRVPCPLWIDRVAARGRSLCFLGRGYSGFPSVHCTKDLLPEWPLETVPLESSAVTVGDRFACALLENGDVACWGANEHGELGTLPSRSRRNRPETVPGVHVVGSVCAGEHFACALTGRHRSTDTGEHRLICWGMLGESRVLPSGGDLGSFDEDQASLLACGARHACVLGAKGEVLCWGDDESGQLGDGRSKSRWTLDFEPIRFP